MINHLEVRRIAAIVCLTALLPLAWPSVQAQNRLQVKQVAVKTNGPDTDVEHVQFAGSAVVNSRMVPDPDFGKPSLLMQFDLTGVTGTGAKSGIRYVLTSQEHVIRPFAIHQNVEFTFPMATDENAPISKVRVGTARFMMNVDRDTGEVTSLNVVMKPR
jgi:hypothetical protein